MADCVLLGTGTCSSGRVDSIVTTPARPKPGRDNWGGIVSASRYRIPSPPADNPPTPAEPNPTQIGAYKNPLHEPRNGESRGNGPRGTKRPMKICRFRSSYRPVARLIDPTATRAARILRRRVSRVTTHRAAPLAAPRTRTAARRRAEGRTRRALSLVELKPHRHTVRLHPDAHTCYTRQLCT